jgi:hypothetical protein
MNDYQTIEAHIDDFRESLRQVTDDSPYSDEFLYKKLLDARNVIVTNELSKNRVINQKYYKFICMKLCEAEMNPCPDCVPDDILPMVLRTKYPLPTSISTTQFDTLTIYSVGMGFEISISTPKRGKYRKYRLVNNVKPYGIIFNNYIYIFNVKQNKLPVIILGAIWHNPADLVSIPTCDEDGNETTNECYNPKLDTFQINNRYFFDMYMMAAKAMGITLQMPDDKTNNANEDNLKTE